MCAGRSPDDPGCRRSRRRRAPSETTSKSIRRARAQSRTAVTSAPTAEMRQVAASASVWAAGIGPSRGVNRPMQFGPRIPAGTGAASRRACLSAPSRPAVMTIAARVEPAQLVDRVRPCPAAQITARSGAVGRSATPAWHATPSSVAWRGLTAWIGPAKVPARRFRQTVAPTLPARSDAPITQTEVGSRRRSRWRTLTSAAQRWHAARAVGPGRRGRAAPSRARAQSEWDRIRPRPGAPARRWRQPR